MNWKVTGLSVLLLATSASVAIAEHEWEDRDIQRGQAIYAETCASCHGAQLEGQPDWQSQEADGTMRAPPHDDSGHTWHHPTNFLLAYTAIGGDEALRRMGVDSVKSGMPAFGDLLSEAEIMDVLAYIRTSWSERAKRHQSRVSHGG